MIGKIRPFNSIGRDEHAALIEFAGDMEDTGFPLSGYLAGKERAGWHVVTLESHWAKMFKVKHAIACNSATSGLVAASFAVGLGPGDKFICPAMTMSATAAAPMFTGATPIFCDVHEHYFSLDPGSPSLIRGHDIKALFLTHLFGIAIDEAWWTGWAHQNGMKIVVDAAQAPFAKCDDIYAGTTADIGVYSLNYHKPVQAGEGGICVTNDDSLAMSMRMFINHAEVFGA